MWNASSSRKPSSVSHHRDWSTPSGGAYVWNMSSSRKPSSVSCQAQGNSTLRTCSKVSNEYLSFPFVAQPLGVLCNHRHPALHSGQSTLQSCKLWSQGIQRQHDEWRIQINSRNSSKVSNKHFFFTLIAQPFGVLCGIRHLPLATTWSCIAFIILYSSTLAHNSFQSCIYYILHRIPILMI